MSKRAFDILPPMPSNEPRTYHHRAIHKDKGKKEKKSLHTFFVFVFGLFFIFVLFSFAKLNNFNITSSGTNATKQTTQKDSSFELFNNQGQSTLSTESQNKIISVKLQDGGTTASNLVLVKDTLLKNGYEINSTEKALITTDKTIIYYKKGDIAMAKKALATLSTILTAQIQESGSLSADYDLLILIGNQ
ncbi:TPA: hypothetical protein DD449_00335 [Candidatus Berkelbacteria bacterium]|uniref:Uncharacterized protein n=1 Tax=Berkelbacteria bacterium GW2011_GWE1_39_12 TaxID=1618337 RepID=A0A0G4B4C8_9BACT|nr:MAG: hypothetical protein UT28_C0001G1022 [Berkelbacteria bacterium GW2011_GWE1_39_12]HBO60121.1 hypothetical protein [Candidatus Berkelbacteria bacterium]